MKFGKRFLHFQGENKDGYLNYKALKQAVKRDCESQDHIGAHFEDALCAELDNVDKHYTQREIGLQKEIAALDDPGISKADKIAALAEIRMGIQDLTNFAALNYSAVLKAVKKRNRRLQMACGDSVVTAPTRDFLVGRRFFASSELAKIVDASHALTQQYHGKFTYPKLMQEFQCPICLEKLSSPARLPCDHAFCWSCITMFCLRVMQQPTAPQPDGGPQLGSSTSCGNQGPIGPSKMSQMSQGWAPQQGNNSSDAKRFECPVCQKQHLLDLEALTVDKHLNDWVDPTSSVSSQSTLTVAEPPGSPGSAHSSEHENSTTAESSESTGTTPRESETAAAPLIPPQEPQWNGKLVIVLDLDGTLIASFPPRRAPYLPKHMRTHLVGKGSSLNPQGVFVVERPGLTEFLQETSQLGELVVFTAGLPEYALPILRAIDPTGAFFGDRIVCRAGTSVSPEYPCVKDLTRLGRSMSRTLIIDDTPLAFLWQPQNGVPVLGFRGASDDNLLLDAVLPLLKNADSELDVRPFLDKRFGMEAWFHGHNYQTNAPKTRAKKATPASRGHEPAAASPEAREYVRSQVALRWTPSVPRGGTMLLCDFDNTILDFDVPERITEQLAPELLPMLVTNDSPKDPAASNKVQIMNSVLEEMRQRGVLLPHLREALKRLGQEIPKSMHAVLRRARGHTAVLRMMSNSNDFFISHVLEGAGMEDIFHDIVTNRSELQHVEPGELERGVMSAQSTHSAPSQISSEKLVILPCQPVDKPHSCPFCPPAFCKGLYVKALLQHHSQVVFCGDGANDLCSVLCLRKTDMAFIRANYKCYLLLKERARQGKGVSQPVCRIEYWSTQDELAELLSQHVTT